MESGINYLVSHAYCDNCKYKWTAVIEVDYIEIMGKRDYKLPDFLDCPECKSKFADYTGIVTDKKNNYGTTNGSKKYAHIWLYL